MLPAHHTSRLFFRCHSVSLRTSRVGYLPGYYSCVALFLPDCNCTCYTIDSYQLFLSIFHTIVSSRLFLCIFYTIVSSGRSCAFSILLFLPVAPVHFLSHRHDPHRILCLHHMIRASFAAARHRHLYHIKSTLCRFAMSANVSISACVSNVTAVRTMRAFGFFA